MHFVQFDPTTSKRYVFPIFTPPHDIRRWDQLRRKELEGPTRIEFQDEYPFLIASRESLTFVNAQLNQILAQESMKVDRQFWDSRKVNNEVALPIQRFRPNIVLKSRDGQKHFPAFSEDSWETIWIKSEKSQDDASLELPIHLVARCERCLLTTVDPDRFVAT